VYSFTAKIHPFIQKNLINHYISARNFISSLGDKVTGIIPSFQTKGRPSLHLSLLFNDLWRKFTARIPYNDKPI